VLSAPRSLNLGVSSNSLYINWMEPLQGGGAVSVLKYLVIYNSNGASKFHEVYQDTELTIEGLTSNAFCYVTVAAEGSNGFLGDSVMDFSRTRAYISKQL